MITVKLPQEMEKLLADMAKASGRTIDEIATEAILNRIEDWEDAVIGLERLKDDDGERIPLSEIVRDLRNRKPGTTRPNPPPNDVDGRVHVKSAKRHRPPAHQGSASARRLP